MYIVYELILRGHMNKNTKAELCQDTADVWHQQQCVHHPLDLLWGQCYLLLRILHWYVIVFQAIHILMFLYV